MARMAWTDERIDERMVALDRTLDMLIVEMRGLRADFRSLERHVSQIGWGLVAALLAALVSLIIVALG